VTLLPFSSRQVGTGDVGDAGFAVVLVLFLIVVDEDVISTQFDAGAHVVGGQLTHALYVLLQTVRYTQADTARLARPTRVQEKHLTANL